jgi:hypothetical protein
MWKLDLSGGFHPIIEVFDLILIDQRELICPPRNRNLTAWAVDPDGGRRGTQRTIWRHAAAALLRAGTSAGNWQQY